MAIMEFNFKGLQMEGHLLETETVWTVHVPNNGYKIMRLKKIGEEVSY